MKKLFALLATLTMCMFMVSACGEQASEEVATTEVEEPAIKLNPHESNGFVFLLPEDFEDFKSSGSTGHASTSSEFYLSKVEVNGPHEVSWGVEDITEEVFYDRESPYSSDLTILEFDNSGTFLDYPAVFAHYTYVIDEIETEHYFYELYLEDGTMCKIILSFNPLDESSLQMNIEDVIAGITKL